MCNCIQIVEQLQRAYEAKSKQIKVTDYEYGASLGVASDALDQALTQLRAAQPEPQPSPADAIRPLCERCDGEDESQSGERVCVKCGHNNFEYRRRACIEVVGAAWKSRKLCGCKCVFAPDEEGKQ